jgi:chromosome segregation ATPase
MTDHKATPEQWTVVEELGCRDFYGPSCILELRARVETLEGKYETMRLATVEWGKDVDKLKRWSDQHLQRIMALEARIHELQTMHNTAVDWRTEQDHRLNQLEAAQQPRVFTAEEVDGGVVPTVKDSLTVPAGSLVERVADALCRAQLDSPSWEPEARAAIREMAEWMRENDCGYNAVRWLEQEAER